VDILGQSAAEVQSQGALEVLDLKTNNTNYKGERVKNWTILTMELVKMAGMESANHMPMPLTKPLPSAVT